MNGRMVMVSQEIGCGGMLSWILFRSAVLSHRAVLLCGLDVD
jgi:hypothetical protein